MTIQLAAFAWIHLRELLGNPSAPPYPNKNFRLIEKRTSAEFSKLMSASDDDEFKFEPDERFVFETKKQMFSPHDIWLVLVTGCFGLFFPPCLILALLWIPMRFMDDNSFRLCLTNKRLIVWEKGKKSHPHSIALSDVQSFSKQGEKVNLLADVCDISMFLKNAGGPKKFEGLKAGEDFATHLAMQLGFKSTNGRYWSA